MGTNLPATTFRSPTTSQSDKHWTGPLCSWWLPIRGFCALLLRDGRFGTLLGPLLQLVHVESVWLSERVPAMDSGQSSSVPQGERQAPWHCGRPPSTRGQRTSRSCTSERVSQTSCTWAVPQPGGRLVANRTLSRNSARLNHTVPRSETQNGSLGVPPLGKRWGRFQNIAFALLGHSQH